jgi:hypothetical protein
MKNKLKIQLFVDNTFPFDLNSFCYLLNSICQNIDFIPCIEKFQIETHVVNCPETYLAIENSIKKKLKNADLNYLLTNVQYDNNYFFEENDNNLIVSFHGWNSYTKLSTTNGLAYFIASNLASDYNIGVTHHENTGCLNDFWWNKTGIDLGMKSAHICTECLMKTNMRVSKTKAIYEDLYKLLDLVSTYSRRNIDILEHLKTLNRNTSFDVFLCHNSEDKPKIREIKESLQRENIRTWLDEDQLVPGSFWQIELENQINEISNVAVFVGENGLGPWQNMEIRAFLSEFVNRGCKVIPVILPNVRNVPTLPIFLRQITWLDLRKQYEIGIQKLISAVK